MTSHVSLEPTGIIGNEWTEACATVNGDSGYQELYLTPSEMQSLYRQLKMYYEQGIWSIKEEVNNA